MKKLLLGLIGLSLVSIPALAGESKLKKDSILWTLWVA
jgi:hypothetical protein